MRKAERFVVMGSKAKSSIRPSSNLPIDKPDRLDNTLKAEGTLKRSMLLEEARHWLRKFDQCILVHGEIYEQLLERIRTVFAFCEEYGITLSKEKYQFGPVVKFAG